MEISFKRNNLFFLRFFSSTDNPDYNPQIIIDNYHNYLSDGSYAFMVSYKRRSRGAWRAKSHYTIPGTAYFTNRFDKVSTTRIPKDDCIFLVSGKITEIPIYNFIRRLLEKRLDGRYRGDFWRQFIGSDVYYKSYTKRLNISIALYKIDMNNNLYQKVSNDIYMINTYHGGLREK